MSTPDSSYIARLAAAARKLAGVHCVGETWISFDGSIPTGGVPFTGQLVSRALYADLWAWVQTNKTVVTDSAWQATAGAQNGMCASYSSGDGSTTFRVPNVVGGYFCGGDTSTAGGYTQAGLPGISGTAPVPWTSALGSFSGALASNASSGNVSYGGSNTSNSIRFDASLSNSIYGRSNTVTPETFRVMVGVYAIGSAGNIGSPEAQAALNAIATLESNRADTSLGNLNAAGLNVAAGASMPSARVVNWSLGASGTQYTAPANGWVHFSKDGEDGTQIALTNISRAISSRSCASLLTALRIFIPCAKGDTINVLYTASGTLNALQFIYAEGAE